MSKNSERQIALKKTSDDKIGEKKRGAKKSTQSEALVSARAEADAAIEQARQAHTRLRDAIDILPHGLVFLDPEGRYILWNQKYADIYKRSADLFQPGEKLEDTLPYSSLG